MFLGRLVLAVKMRTSSIRELGFESQLHWILAGLLLVCILGATGDDLGPCHPSRELSWVSDSGCLGSEPAGGSSLSVSQKNKYILESEIERWAYFGAELLKSCIVFFTICLFCELFDLCVCMKLSCLNVCDSYFSIKYSSLQLNAKLQSADSCSRRALIWHWKNSNEHTFMFWIKIKCLRYGNQIYAAHKT